MIDQICRDLNGFDGFVNELKVAVAEQMGAGNEVSSSWKRFATSPVKTTWRPNG